MAYKTIADALSLDRWLYKQEDRFERFAMNGIYSSDIQNDLSVRASVLIEKDKIF